MLLGLNGYTICSGVISEELNGPDIIPKPLVVDDYMEIGYILPNSVKPSVFTLSYIDILKKYVIEEILYIKKNIETKTP